MRPPDPRFYRDGYGFNIKVIANSSTNGNVEDRRLTRKDKHHKKRRSIFDRIKCKRQLKLEDRSYFQEMKPLLYTLCALGRFPQHLNTSNIVPFKVMSFTAVYTGIFFTVQTTWTSIAVWELFTSKLTKDADFDQFIFWTSILSFLGQNFIIPVTYWADSYTYLAYLQKWNIMQENFNRFGLKVCGNYNKMLLWVSLLNIPLTVLFISVELNILGDLNIYFFLAFACVLLASLTSLIMWCATFHKIRLYADKLLKMIAKAAISPDNNNQAVDCIIKAKKLWMDLREATSGMGLAIARTALSIHVSIFISFVLTTYGFLSSVVINNSRTPSNIALIFISLLTLISTFIIFDTADRTVQKIGPQFITAILKMDTEVPSPIAKALHKLIQTINAHPPVVHYDGFVVVNRSLFVSFISNTVTYLVVLIQFKTSSLGQQKRS